LRLPLFIGLALATCFSQPALADVDPPRDALHPARLEQIRYPTGGVQVPARLFVASGAGLHPTVLLLHGFPGTELNLDLAREFQRAGWNVLAIHYRGVWGARAISASAIRWKTPMPRWPGCARQRRRPMALIQSASSLRGTAWAASMR
jgi:pimeloyl-ACP methyl ester carboxylesterase